MVITSKTLELASIIGKHFESSRLKAEAINQELGRHKFIIVTKAPNLIAIQVPKVIKVNNYTESIFSIVESIIDETRFKVTEPIEIHIYGPDQAHVDSRTVFPTSKGYLN
jgi:hypothetical protein